MRSPLELAAGGPHLVAGRCSGCGAFTFPLRERCPACAAPLERTLLPRQGVLWTWTTQGFPPPAPPYRSDGEDQEFEPYGVGYVEFPGYLRVEGRLTVSDPDALRIGMPMEVVALERAGDVTYAFASVDDDGAR